MIREELQQLSTTSRELRKFGLLVGGVFLLLGGWFWFRHKGAWPYLLAPGTLLVLLGLAAPRSLKGIYVAWMGLAFTLGLAVTTVLLTLFYFLVVTPIALVARLCGQDFLAQNLDPQAPSYWLKRDRAKTPRPADYERQF
jgi:hypothetical protein